MYDLLSVARHMMATEWKVNFPECCDGVRFYSHCLGIQRSFSSCERSSRESERNDTRRVPFEHVASLRTAFVAQPRIWWR